MGILKLDTINTCFIDAKNNTVSFEDSIIQFTNDLTEIQEIDFNTETIMATLNQLIEIKDYIDNNGPEGAQIIKADLEAIGIQFDNKEIIVTGLEGAIVDTIKKVWDWIKQFIAKVLHVIKSFFTSSKKIDEQIKNTIQKIKEQIKEGKKINKEKLLNQTITALPAKTLEEFISYMMDFAMFFQHAPILAIKDPKDFDEIDADIVRQYIEDALKKVNVTWKTYLGIDKVEGVPKAPTSFPAFKVEKRTLKELGYDKMETLINPASFEKLLESLVKNEKIEKLEQTYSSFFQRLSKLKNIEQNVTASGVKMEDTFQNRLKIARYTQIFMSAFTKYMKMKQQIKMTVLAIVKAMLASME